MSSHRFRQASLLILARGAERFGVSGWIGLVLCAVAAAWFAQVWMQHQQPVRQDVVSNDLAEPLTVVPVPRESNSTAMTMARQDEQALLLTQIQQVAVSHGLAWTAADYKLIPAGESTPVMLEVRCTLKGAYPRLRAALAQWLRQVPGLAIRDLALTRPSSEVAEVEAKLQLVVFLRSEAAEVRP